MSLLITCFFEFLSKNVKNIFSEIKHIDVNYNHYEYKLLYKIFNSTSSEFLRDYKKLENEKSVSNDKISALQRQAAIELEQSKFLTSNVLKSTTA